MALRKGQMSFHHCRMIHGSGVNRGDRPRTSIALHPANGHPDYSDPAAFPVLWSADGAR
jgi:ectoine hydroxylase-related dioxygenase (phytanoyl-CoA dioxygenase family)